MTDTEIIEVVTAHKEGKKIEHRTIGLPDWHECDYPSWNFKTYEYRVAPEPRKPNEWWIKEKYLDKKSERSSKTSHYISGEPLIHVREVEGALSGYQAVASHTVKTSPESAPRKPREWTLAIERSTGHVYRAIENQPINQNFEDELVHVIEVIE